MAALASAMRLLGLTAQPEHGKTGWTSYTWSSASRKTVEVRAYSTQGIQVTY